MDSRGNRRSVRLEGEDYSRPGGYFVTVMTYQRECLFGRIDNDEMQLNDHGDVADECWRAIPQHVQNVELGTYVIMPNHMHGIIQILDGDRRGEVISPSHEVSPSREVISPNREVISPREEQNPQYPGGETPPLRKPTLGQIVAYFKYRSTREMNLLDDSGAIVKFWQRNYGACPECSEGSTSSAITKIGIESTATSNPIRPCGRRTTKIRPA